MFLLRKIHDIKMAICKSIKPEGQQFRSNYNQVAKLIKTLNPKFLHCFVCKHEKKIK